MDNGIVSGYIGGCCKLFRFIGFFPGEVRKLSAEVAIGGSCLVYWSKKVQMLDDGFRAKVKTLGNNFLYFVIRNFTCSETVDVYGYRLCNTNCVGNLDFYF
jgi:hypothetical protein